MRNPKFKLRRVVKCLQDQIEPLREKLLWGPLVPYNITGHMNRHPNQAIKFLDTEGNRNFLKFFDEIITDV